MGDLTPCQPKGSETILSEEIWEKVLMNLTDPSDILNAGKTCVQFQRILGSKMVDAYLAKTLPLLMNYMDDKSVLKCRSVSTVWRGVVDNYLENYFLERTTLEPVKELKPFPVTKTHCALYPFGMRNGDSERFMEEMKDHPRNPFIGRAVHIGLEGVLDRENFRRFYNFFEIFGKHIWTLELNMFNVIQLQLAREFTFTFIIRVVFELAPNLRKLFVNRVPLLVTMMKSEVRAPAPPPSLEKLHISTLPLVRSYVPRDYAEIEDILRNQRYLNSHIRARQTKSLLPLRNLNWPNLKELHFTEHVNELDNIFRNLRLPKLELLSIAFGLKLAYDRVYEEWMEREENETFTKFFPALNNLCISSPNLKTLRFGTTWLWDKMYEQPVGFPEGLPCPENIKTLEIPEETLYQATHDFQTTSDYSFLLRFPHVENIHVYRDVRGPMHQPGTAFNEIVEVHKFMYSGRMYESNVWELLPKLKVFSYGERVYTRSSYERRLAKRKLKIQE